MVREVSNAALVKALSSVREGRTLTATFPVTTLAAVVVFLVVLVLVEAAARNLLLAQLPTAPAYPHHPP